MAIKCCSTLARLHSRERQPIRAGLLPVRSEGKDNAAANRKLQPAGARAARVLEFVKYVRRTWDTRRILVWLALV